MKPLTNREYRNLRGTKKLVCLKCGQTPHATWSWDNDWPTSGCCDALIAIADQPMTTANRACAVPDEGETT